MYNYSKLKGRITEICGTQAVFAEKMSISPKSLSSKLQNKIDFRQDEISKAISVLQLNESDIQAYFFTQNVQNA